ncbi:MAG: hypothetical protein PHC64_05335 [Candidatus Gastranaerophilales bacterium]|nr:hypothetical protein [Candidatus Gastranaerophilales bacterium]
MNLTVNPLGFNNRKYQNSPQHKPLGCVVKSDFQYTPKISLAQKAYAMPLISFGSFNPLTLEAKLSRFVAKYSAGDCPVILSVRKGFIGDLVEKIVENPDKHLIIGLAGESASGKTTIVQQSRQVLGEQISTIEGDDFYHDTSETPFAELLASGYSFDVPGAFDINKLSEVLKRAHLANQVYLPSYDKVTCKSKPCATLLPVKQVTLLDFIFALQPGIKGLLDIGIYVECPKDVIETRWFERAASRGKTPEVAQELYRDVQEKAQKYCNPTKANADVVLNGNTDIGTWKKFLSELGGLFQDLS